MQSAHVIKANKIRTPIKLNIRGSESRGMSEKEEAIALFRQQSSFKEVGVQTSGKDISDSLAGIVRKETNKTLTYLD